jgi:hypothetical protein
MRVEALEDGSILMRRILPPAEKSEFVQASPGTLDP